MDARNWLSDCVIQTILLPENSETRVHRLRTWIEILECLKTLKNFDSAMAVLGGLENFGIGRLKQTWYEIEMGQRILGRVEGGKEGVREGGREGGREEVR
jgi:hypothetical protein